MATVTLAALATTGQLRTSGAAREVRIILTQPANTLFAVIPVPVPAVAIDAAIVLAHRTKIKPDLNTTGAMLFFLAVARVLTETSKADFAISVREIRFPREEDFTKILH